MRSRSVTRWVTGHQQHLLLTASLLPIIAIGAYITRNGINVPYWDEWDASLRIALKAASGNLTFSDLLAQHGQQRLFFTQLLTALLTYTVNWNTKIEMFVSFALAIANLLLLFSLYRRSQPSVKAAIPTLLPFSLLVFSFRQRQNWLMGFQNSWFFLILLLLGALWVLQRHPVGWKPLVAAAILCLGATFAFLPGVLVWPVLLVTLFMLGYRKLGYYAFWLAGAALSLTLFFKGYAFVETVARTETGQFMMEPVLMVRYLASYLGSPLVGEGLEFVTMAAFIGLGGLAIYLVNMREIRLRDGDWLSLAVWNALVLFVLTTGLLTSLGRIRIFIGAPTQPLSQRYVTVDSLFWLAVVAVVTINMRHYSRLRSPSRWQERLWYANLIALTCMAGFYAVANIRASRWPPLVTKEQEVCVVAYPESSDTSCLHGLYPDMGLLTERIEVMHRHQLGPFAGPARGRIATTR